MLHHGDLFDVLPMLEADSIDACVTDPPYNLSFMGKQWDSFKGQKEYEAWTETWAREVYRVLKPGAHMLVCGAPRSGHRMIAGVEDAGFEIRDCLCWLFGQGFPKSLDIGKAIDKAAGAKREAGEIKIRPDGTRRPNKANWTPGQAVTYAQDEWTRTQFAGGGNHVTATATEAAKQWDGWGTALKPAFEMIVLARKPFKGSVAQNVLTHGTGGINVDACRIAGDEDGSRNRPPSRLAGNIYAQDEWTRNTIVTRNDTTGLGRWPANVLLDDQAAAMLDEMSGECASGGVTHQPKRSGYGGWESNGTYVQREPDSGGASRFFYVAKPSNAERNLGHYDSRQSHPTVKPIELMRWLIRLITPPGGTVLDPFCGSGTTGCAAAFELRPFIGIEREAEYVQIAERRIRECAPLFQDPAV